MKTTDYTDLADQYATHRRVHPQVVSALVARLDPDSRVLEIGCGTGNYIAAISELAGCECAGLDPSAAMLGKLRARGLRITIVEGRAEQVDLPEDSFDLVYTVDVIHHVGDREAAFRGAYRLLKEGGHVCTVTDSEWMIRNREPQSIYFPETIDVELQRYPSIQALRVEMEQAGFESVQEEVAENRYTLSDSAAYRNKVFSSLLYIGEEAFRRGLARLDHDLRQGPVRGVSRYVLLWGAKPITGHSKRE